MFRTIFTIVCMSIFVTSAFAQNKLTPTIYTLDEYENKYKVIQLVRGGIVSAAHGGSPQENICRAFGQVAQYLGEELMRSEDGLSIISRAHTKIYDHIVTTTHEIKTKIINKMKTKTSSENINIEFGKDFLHCKIKSKILGGNHRHYRSSVKGNIGFRNIQSKQIRIIDYGGVRDPRNGLQLFIVLAIAIPDIQ